MSAEQAILAVAGSICAGGAVVAAAHDDGRLSGAALTVTLLSLAVLYAGLAAPVLAAASLALALFVTAPIVVHLTVPAPRAHAEGGPFVAGAALLVGAALLAVLALAISGGELPLNVSVRSSDGYDLGGLRDLITGRGIVSVGGTVTALIAAVVAARAVRRVRGAPQ
jgi:hypothetical protein